MNKLKRLGTIYNNMESVCGNCIKLQNEIKELKDEIKLLNEKNNILNNIIKDNVDPKDNNGNDFLINQQKKRIEELIKENKIQDLNIKDSEEYKKLENELKDVKDDYINIQNNNEKDDIIFELKNTVYELNNKISNINKINEELNINNNKPKELVETISHSPSTSKENKIDESSSGTISYKHKFNDKSLPILERCNVKPYTYNKKLNDNKKALQILEFMDSEHKVIVRFNSCIAEKVNEVNIEEIWKEIFKHKVENNELSNSPSSKSNFKYKILRCQELYKLYDENLSKFQIYIGYIGRLTDSEWKEYLKEFDKLYNNTINTNNKCKHLYKNGKLCDRVDCNVKHKEIR